MGVFHRYFEPARRNRECNGYYCESIYFWPMTKTNGSLPRQVIAIYTLGAVIWGARSNVWRKLLPAYLIIGCISLFLAIFIGITVGTQIHGTQHYMAPAGVSRSQIFVVVEFMSLRQFWCWIHPGSRYNAQHLVGEYVWIWSVFVVSVITYLPLVLVIRGSLSVSADYWWKFTFRQRRDLQVGSRKLMILMATLYWAYTSILRQREEVRFSLHLNIH
jgi:hypothetical protein